MNVGDLNKVWEIRALKRKPATEEATKMLEKIAKQVQPIMRKHKWRVKLLSEFWYIKFPFSLFIGLFVCLFKSAMPFIFNYLKEKTYTQYYFLLFFDHSWCLSSTIPVVKICNNGLCNLFK